MEQRKMSRMKTSPKTSPKKSPLKKQMTRPTTAQTNETPDSSTSAVKSSSAPDGHDGLPIKSVASPHTVSIPVATSFASTTNRDRSVPLSPTLFRAVEYRPCTHNTYPHVADATIEQTAQTAATRPLTHCCPTEGDTFQDRFGL